MVFLHTLITCCVACIQFQIPKKMGKTSQEQLIPIVSAFSESVALGYYYLKTPRNNL